ncbi:MAG: VOC family protein [Spirosomaceae bacterium]|jgi:lactoylglutathione lyase|nr:VOC family protein [Spirosomataceae bacterium]
MRIEHIAIYCKDLEAMRGFYEKYFDGKSNEKYINAKKGFESYFISFSDGARLELMQMASIPTSKNDIYAQFTGLIHFAVSVGSKEKVDELTERFRNDGIEIIGEPRWTGDGYYESVILDIEGNRIEITI